MRKDSQLRAYLVVTAAYWGFTLTDGALRMLVLGHFHALGYSPFALALLFVLYEFFGALTNIIGGWIGSRTGLRLTLVLGLGLQVLALAMLGGLSSDWSLTMQVAYVAAAQGLSGIAKDFTKLSAKSAIKILVPTEGANTLFRWVAYVTGSKNSLKGLGFFVGAFLLGALGFNVAVWSMAAGLVLVTGFVVLSLPKALGRAKTRARLSETWRGGSAIKILSAARLFLFGARDSWFVVGLPVFLSEVLGWSFLQVGSYLAIWVVGYGAVQACTPHLLPSLGRNAGDDARAARVWCTVLAAIPLAIFGLVKFQVAPEIVIVAGLALFGVVFAINSALHSYLILAYSTADNVSLNVGFYYMSNALGRLLGTLLSGILYQLGGLGACLLCASAMVVVASLLSRALPQGRLASTASATS